MSTYMTLLPRRQPGTKADNVVVNTLEMRPADRTDQDIEIITSKLKKLNVLQLLPENVIEEIGRHATTKSFAANRPVVIPDVTVTHLYIILTGSVAVMVIDLNDPSKFVSLCTLTTGCSFGETCIFGKQSYKDIMITTCEDTDVMCVEGELMKKLFMSHGSELDKSLLASNPSADYGPAVSAAIRTLWQMISFHFGDHLRDHGVGTMVYPACSSGRELVDWLLSYQRSPLWTRQQITMIGQVLLNEGFLKQVLGEPVFQDTSSTHYQYLLLAPTSPQPIFPPPLFSPSVRHTFQFTEEHLSPLDPDLPSPISQESLPSLLDQCINTILQHSSDVLATNASLRKSSFHRTKGDLDVIVEDIKYMKGFMYLPESAQEKLAKYVYVQNYPHAASYICRQGDDVKCWYTILKGSVNVLRDEEVVCTLHLYDNFGKDMIEKDLKWPVTFQLRHNFGIVLCVDKKDLLELNSELKANTITEDGWEVVMEKKASPDQKRRANSMETRDTMDSATLSRRTLQRIKSRVTLRGRLCSVKKASPNKIVDRLVQSDMDQGDVTTIFAEDFFLTYLSFMTTEELCSKLLDKYIVSGGLLGGGGEEEGVDGTKYLSVPGSENVTISNGHGSIDASFRKRNIAKHVAVWIQAGSSLLLIDPAFKQFLTQLQNRLAKDELLSEQEILRQAIATAMQANSTWLETASRLDAVHPDTPSKDPYQYLGIDPPASASVPNKHSPLGGSPRISPILRRNLQSPPVGESPTLKRRDKEHRFVQNMKIALRGRSEDSIPLSLGFSMFPPFSPNDKDEVVVHLNRKEAVSLSLQMEDTARVILNKACKHFKLDPSRHDLCELDSAGVKVVMKLQTASVHTKMSVNGRLFVFSASASIKMPELVLPEQIVGPNKPFPINEQSMDIAAHLTLYDWNLFMNIPQMEFIYQAFELYKVGKVTTNLDIMTRRFNEIHGWVITELCLTQDIQKRTRLLQKFIKIAGHCLNFKNLNSFLAIVLALDNITVTRMHKVWKEVHAGLKEQLEYFKTFTNTSSNFKQLRDFQRMQEPPVIPYLPMMLKDGFFIHQHNETFVKSSVNFEKMHMMANMVRGISFLKTGTLSRDIYQVVSRNQALQGYIRSLKVIDNQKLQMDMSYLIEPKFHSSS